MVGCRYNRGVYVERCVCMRRVQVWSVAYNPAGDKLVSGCDDGVLQVFEKAA